MASRFEQAVDKRDPDALRKAVERMKSPEEDIGMALFQAVVGSDASTLEFLLDTLHPPIEATLMHLVSDETVLRLLVAHGGDINAVLDDSIQRRWTPLHSAAYNERLDVMPTLVELGADVDARDRYGRSPLICAAEAMADDGVDAGMATISLLAKLGADPSLTDYYGNSATVTYRFACKFRWTELDEGAVRSLVEIGSPDDKPTFDLFMALFDKDIEGVRQAIAAGADVNRISPQPWGSTPLESAAGSGNTDMVQLLLNAGADPNKPGDLDTPLIEAARSGHLPVVKQLIEAGADIEGLAPRDAEERVPTNAYLAADYNSKHEVVDYLKSLGSGMPKPKQWKPIEPGVGDWNDFSELLVKADVARTADALAKMIGGKVEVNAYGRSFSPGKRAFVLARPKGMDWTNVFRVAPPQLRSEGSDEKARFAAELAQAAAASVLTIDYSDTAGAGEIGRYEPTGGGIIDDGWDDEMLEEVADALGDDVPDTIKERLAEIDPEKPRPSSEERIETLAKEEKFAVAEFAAYCEPGRNCDVEFAGYPAEAFDGVAYVSD